MILRHNRTIGRHSKQNLLRQHCFYVLRMGVNAASMAFGIASYKMQDLCSNLNPQSHDQLPF